MRPGVVVLKKCFISYSSPFDSSFWCSKSFNVTLRVYCCFFFKKVCKNNTFRIPKEKETVNTTFLAEACVLNFFGWVIPYGGIPWTAFCSKGQWWTQVSSPVIIFFKKSSPSFSKRSRGSREMRTLSAFISSDSMRGTYLEQTFRNPRTPIMCPTLSLEIPNATAISFSFMRRFPRISSSTRSWWSWSLVVIGLPLRVCHSNLLAPILHLWTALPSVLLYSHQHTDHHKRLAFVCEFQLEELFPRLTLSVRTEYIHSAVPQATSPGAL